MLAAKKACNVTFNQVAEAIGLTNVATANIFYRQVPVQPLPASGCQIAGRCLNPSEPPSSARAGPPLPHHGRQDACRVPQPDR